MAGNPIFHEDIAKVKELQKSIIDFIPVLIQMREQVQASAKANLEHAKSMSMDKEAIIGLAKVTDELKTQNIQITKAIKDTTEASKKFSEAEKAAAELDKQRSREKAKYLSDLAKQEAKQRDLIKAAEMEVKSIDDLAKKTSAMIALRKQMTDITGKNKDAFEKLTNEINKNQDALKKHDAQIGNHQRSVGYYQKAWEGLKGAFLMVSGAVAAAAGAISFAKAAFQSNEAGMDRWRIVTQQASGAYQVLLTTIRNGDWSNFLTNIREAIKEGERYAYSIDELEKRQRGLGGRVAKRESESERLKLQARTEKDESGKPVDKETALGYAREALRIEKENLSDIQNIQKDRYENEIDHIKSVTKLSKEKIESYILEYGVNEDLLKQSKSILAKEKEAADLESRSMAISPEGVVTQYPEMTRQAAALRLEISKMSDEAKSGAKVLKSMEEGALDPKFVDKAAESYKALQTSSKDYYSGIARISMAMKRLENGVIEGQEKEEKKLATDREKNIKTREEAEKAFYDFKVKYGMASLEEQQANEIAELQKMDEYKKASIQQQGEAEAAIRAKFIALSILEEEKKNQAIKESNDRLIASQASEKKNKGESIDKGTSASLSGVVSSATAGRGTELSDLQDLYAQKLIAAEEYKRREKEINEKYDQQILEKSIEVIKQSIAAKRAASLDTEKDEKELAGIEIELAEFVRLKKKENIEKNRDDEKEEWNKKLAIVKEFASAAQGILSNLSDWYKQDAQNQTDAVEERYDTDLSSLDRQLAAKTISEEKYNKEKIKLDAKRKQDELKIQKEAAEKQKTIQTIQAVINTALAVTGALSTQPVWLGILMAVLVGAMGAVEIATIQSAKFAQGGHGLLLDKSKGGILKGNSHSKGGISLGDIGEAEGGEYFGIVNKSATEKYRNTLPILFDAINQGKFENMFARQGSNVVVNVNDKYGKEMLAEMKQTKSQTVTMDMGDYVLYQTGNYTLKVRKS